MTAITVTARCHGCDWTTGPAPWPDVDKAADKHTAPGHPTVTMADGWSKTRYTMAAAVG